MCGSCHKSTYVPNHPKRIIDNSNCKPKSYYEDLLLNEIDPYRKQLIQSQLNVYEKDCKLFEQYL